MENNRLEDSFKNAFSGAEMAPSDGVWTGVELDLEKASGGKMKRNLLLFQLLAAASVAFAFGIGALYYLDRANNHSDKVQSLAATQRPVDSNQSDKSTSDSKQNISENQIQSVGKQSKVISKESVTTIDDKQARNSVKIQLPDTSSEPVQTETYHRLQKPDLMSLVKARKPALTLPEPEKQSEPDAGMVLLAQLKDREKQYAEEDKKAASVENVWASVGFGAGSYKPNRETILDKSSSSATGDSYSVGLSVAGKLSKRFIVQGGVSYLTQNADFSSSSSSQGAATLIEYSETRFIPNSIGSNLDITSNPYQVNSSVQFVSIPVQAGYLVIDRAFGLQLNGGISTDLFISNTLSAENADYQKVTQRAGEDSPYRTVNFSGLVGTELSYKIANHYRISLNPGLRYSLNSIYKEEIAAEVTPVTFDVSLRFRYIFK